jgi:hypothetical protein
VLPAGEPLGFPLCPQCPYVRVGPAWVCVECASKTLEAIAPRACPICSQRLAAGDRCRNSLCNDPNRRVERIFAIAYHSGTLQEKISRYKYGSWLVHLGGQDDRSHASASGREGATIWASSQMRRRVSSGYSLVTRKGCGCLVTGYVALRGALALTCADVLALARLEPGSAPGMGLLMRFGFTPIRGSSPSLRRLKGSDPCSWGGADASWRAQVAVWVAVSLIPGPIELDPCARWHPSSAARPLTAQSDIGTVSIPVS